MVPLQQLIFSEKRSSRILRHLLFWAAWAVYFIGTYMAFPFLPPAHSYFRNIPLTLGESLIHLILQAMITYTTLYFVLPIYTREKKFFKALLVLLACWTLYYFLHFNMVKTGTPAIMKSILPAKYLQGAVRPTEMIRFTSLLGVFLGALSTTIFIASFKYIKQWYIKDQRNTELQKENAESQLQLLTAQVHPHFLFNTLNNIYSTTQTESPEGSKMIMGLSDLLRYILYEGKKPRVPLDQELQMIIEYMNLEKMRYGSDMDMHYRVTGETEGVYIAPLLLLPFLENCYTFDNASSHQRSWINLTIDVNDHTLAMKLMSGGENYQPRMEATAAMINVRQRLELLYQGRYELQILEEEEAVIVQLKLELAETERTETKTEPTITESLYA